MKNFNLQPLQKFLKISQLNNQIIISLSILILISNQYLRVKLANNAN